MIDSAARLEIDQLAQDLARSVILVDSTAQVLYASEHYGDEDPARIRAVLNHAGDLQARGYVLAQGVTSWTRAGIIPANENLGMHARACVAVRREGDLLGLLIVMDRDGCLTTNDLDRISELAQELSLVLHNAAHAQSMGELEGLVLDLVSPDSSTRRRAVADLTVRGQSQKFSRVTAVSIGASRFRASAGTHIEFALRHALSERMGEKAGDQMYAFSGDTATVIMAERPSSTDDVERRVERLVDRTHELAAGQFRCVAGLGDSGEGLGSVHVSLTQARIAHEAAVLGLRGPVTAWSSLGAYGPLLSIPADQLTTASVPAELQRLLAVDSNGQFAATVRAFLDAAGNGPVAAQKLHIHRTSLYYRLGRVQELTGLDLTDGVARLAVHIGLAMLDIIEARSES